MIRTYLADEIAEPRPDMNIKVAAFTVSEKSSNPMRKQAQVARADSTYWIFIKILILKARLHWSLSLRMV